MNSIMINKDRLDKLATELAKGGKFESDLADPLGQLMKLTIEKALNAEMDSNQGYEKNSSHSQDVNMGRY